MTTKDIKTIAKNVIVVERDTLSNLVDAIDQAFVEVVELVFGSKHRLILCGIGKSAIIAQKIVATLNSTGTPAIFLHAADAIHGDAGMIMQGDIVLIISKSGDTAETVVLGSLVKTFGNIIIAMVANKSSALAKMADHIIYTPIDAEADPNALAPTSSTIAQIAMGDALAICLLELRGFSKEEFARVHPGGNLGKRLYTTVDHMYKINGCPKVQPDSPIEYVILQISEHRLGATAVVDAEDNLLGIITDGDLRRMIQTSTTWSTTTAKDIMTHQPKRIESLALAVEAVALAQQHNITQIPVVQGSKYVGMLHLHDFIREGLV